MTRARRSDVPYDAFGGAGPPLHFAHANGFPPATYRQFLAPLAQHHRVIAIRQRPLWPEARREDFHDWRVLGDDLVRLLDGLGARDVVGVGHSLGGVATLYAAVARPELFRALVLIEPVLLEPARLKQLYTGDLGPVERIPIVQSALQRRERWPNRQAAFDHWRPKPVFARLSDEALWDYVAAAVETIKCEPASKHKPAGACARGQSGEPGGSIEDPGVALVYPRDWEARIYATPPTDVWDLLPRVTQPTLALRGAETDTITPAAWAAWQRLQPGATFADLPGVGHLLPMEAPGRVAEVVLGFVGDLAV